MFEEVLFTKAEELAFRQLDLKTQQTTLLAKYAERNSLVSPGATILVGDSLTEFLPHTKLVLDGPLYNRGIRGIGIDYLRTHLDDLVFDLAPSRVVLLIGTNDLMFGMSPDVLVSQIEELVEQLKAKLPLSEIYLQSLYPRRESLQWGDALSDEIEVVNLYLRNLRGVTYLDSHARLVGSDGQLKEDYTRDGVHLTMMGYSVVLDVLQQYL